jgi:hypothetical protein
MPRVALETVERIITSDPYRHWWHGGPDAARPRRRG